MAIAFLLGRLTEVVAAGAGHQVFCHLGGEGEHRRGDGDRWRPGEVAADAEHQDRSGPPIARTVTDTAEALAGKGVPLDEVEGVEEAGRLSTVALHRYQLLPGQPLG